jgi:hypothetical protein
MPGFDATSGDVVVPLVVDDEAFASLLLHATAQAQMRPRREAAARSFRRFML